MGIYANLNNEISKNLDSFNIILADKDVDTFKKIQKLNNKFNFINLSSYFAVSFILEYEKIDLIIISRKISNLSDIIKKADKKKINVYVLGKDISLPVNEKKIENIILKEIERKASSKKNRRFDFKKCISNLLNLDINRKLILRPGFKNQEKIKKHSKEAEKENKSEYKKEKPLNFVNNMDSSERKEKSNCKDDVDYSQPDPEKDYVKSYSDRDLIPENDLKIKSIKTIKQKVIILSKAKGGVGSTTISIFLSFIFKKISTLLVDLNFSEGGGDISYYLGIPKSPNILNFIDGYNRDSLKNSVIKIRENLDVLQAPPTYEMSRKVDLQDIYCLADIAKKKYHLIIFDLPNKFDDLLLGVIDLADLLIMVSDYTPGSIGRLIKMNNRFVYDDLERILIINKYDKANGLNLFRNQIEQFFNLKDFLFLDENEILRKRSEFLNFDFNSIKNFNCLAEKVLDLLTCD